MQYAQDDNVYISFQRYHYLSTFDKIKNCLWHNTKSVLPLTKLLKNNKYNFSTKRAQGPHSNCELIKSGLQSSQEKEILYKFKKTFQFNFKQYEPYHVHENNWFRFSYIPVFASQANTSLR